jgi:hypothetical protein
MNALKWFAIAVTVVVGETLIFAAYVVQETGTTDALAAIGWMVAQIVGSFVLR